MLNATKDIQQESLLSAETNLDAAPKKPRTKVEKEIKALSDYIQSNLDENSAQDIIEIDIRGKSSIADYMIVASGRSNRHVGALADYVQRGLKDQGLKNLGIEGLKGCDWVLIDAGDVIVHIFRPEVRVFYNLEKIWSVPLPEGLQNVAESAPDDDYEAPV
ncbi:ribosome silencing factor [Litorimonas sp. RW-G-Af-16]|uniref:ribosome silencing factor n=1 Tax=Litorimonas sp. RW-G-Af-16 TaxID=3241168 RepID=UPI00390C4B9C